MKLINDYLTNFNSTETPAIYTRWALHTAFGALIDRGFFFPEGNTQIRANHYTVLVGDVGVKKSSPILALKGILDSIPSVRFSQSRIAKAEDLVQALHGEGEDDEDDIWASDTFSDYSKMFILNDEATEIFGQGNPHLLSLYTAIWQMTGKHRTKSLKGKILEVDSPCPSILTATTPKQLSLIAPSALAVEGFLSRLLLIYARPTLQRVAFGAKISEEDKDKFRGKFMEMQSFTSMAKVELSPRAKELLEKIYLSDEKIADGRFAGYNHRRFTHLLKLCLIAAASDLKNIILPEHVYYAYTTLWHAEQFMPRALGEYGLSKTSGIQQTLLSFIQAQNSPVMIEDILRDLKGLTSRLDELQEILRVLQSTHQIQVTKLGYLPMFRQVNYKKSKWVSEEFLSLQEREMIL